MTIKQTLHQGFKKVEAAPVAPAVDLLPTFLGAEEWLDLPAHTQELVLAAYMQPAGTRLLLGNHEIWRWAAYDFVNGLNEDYFLDYARHGNAASKTPLAQRLLDVAAVLEAAKAGSAKTVADEPGQLISTFLRAEDWGDLPIKTQILLLAADMLPKGEKLTDKPDAKFVDKAQMFLETLLEIEIDAENKKACKLIRALSAVIDAA